MVYLFDQAASPPNVKKRATVGVRISPEVEMSNVQKYKPDESSKSSHLGKMISPWTEQ